MGINTKLSLNSNKFEQLSGDTLNLSGSTNFYNGLTISDGTQSDGYVLTSDSGGTASWQSLSEITDITSNFYTGDTHSTGIAPKLWADTILGASALQLSTGSTVTGHTVGRFSWNPVDGTANLNLFNNVNLQLGEEQIVYGKNINGVQIPDGTVVRPYGASGGTIFMGKAIADSSIQGHEIGMTTSDVEANSFGYATTFGKVRGLDTSMWSGGTPLWLSPLSAGTVTDVEPVYPQAKVPCGIVIKQDAVEGEIFFNPIVDYQPQINNLQYYDDYFIGTFIDKCTQTITVSGGTVYFKIERDVVSGSTDFRILVGTDDILTFSAQTIALNAGTDNIPVLNYISMIPSGIQIQTGWFTGNALDLDGIFSAVATVLCQSPSGVTSDGVYKHHGWIDKLATTTRGDNVKVAERLRQENAKYKTGILQTYLLTPNGAGLDRIDISTTQGVVYQKNRNTFPILTTVGDVNPIFVANLTGDNYRKVTDLGQLNYLADGTVLSNGARTSIVVWGVVSQNTGDCKYYANLSTDSYGSDELAINDPNNYSVYTADEDFRGTAFLISRLVVKYAIASSGTWEILDEISLLGQEIGIGGGLIGGGGTIAVKNSIEQDVDLIYQLVGDELTPDAGKFYGITGTSKGWYTPDISSKLDITDFNTYTGDTWTSNGVDMYNNNTGNVGIGTDTPTQKLHIVDGRVSIQETTASDYAVLYFGNDESATEGGFFLAGTAATAYGGARSMNLINLSNGAVALGTNNSVDLLIDNGGNVGIGTDNPIRPLHIAMDDNAFNIPLRLENTATGSTAYSGFEMRVGGNEIFYFQSTESVNVFRGIPDIPMLFYTNNTQRLYLSNDGNLGIGDSTITTPTTTLDIQDATEPYMTFSSPTTVTADMLIGSYGFFSRDGTASSSGGLGGMRMYAETAYNTAATPSYLTFYTHDNTGNDDTILGDVTERMRINAAGYVGIGTMNPQALLDIRGGTSTVGTLLLGRSHATVIGTNFGIGQIDFGGEDIDSGFSNWTAASIKGIADSTWTSASDTPTRLAFYTTADSSGVNSERMRINPEGNIGIGITNPQYTLDINDNGLGFRWSGDSNYFIVKDWSLSSAYGPQIVTDSDRIILPTSIYFGSSQNYFRRVGTTTEINGDGGVDFTTYNGSTYITPLSINNIGNITVNGNINQNGSLTTTGFTLTDGTQNAGYILTSDSGGTASWQSISGITGTTGSVSGENITKEINQTTHGFTVKDVIGFSGSTYNKAIADGTYDGEVLGIVSEVVDVNNFKLIQAGYVSGLTGLVTNTTYFLSDVTYGLLTSTEPTVDGSISNSILIAASTTSAWILPYAGYIITSGSSSSGTWGDITGTLSNQTDLQNALDAKLDTSDFDTYTGNTWGINGNDIYTTNTGNTGIGTDTPLAKLHISGGTGSLATGIAFGNGDSGIAEVVDDEFGFYFPGGMYYSFNPTEISSESTGRFEIKRTAASPTVPAYTFRGYTGTGVGINTATNGLSLISNSVEGLRINSASAHTVAGIANYETLVVNDDDIPNKKYTDNPTITNIINKQIPIGDNSTSLWLISPKSVYYNGNTYVVYNDYDDNLRKIAKYNHVTNTWTSATWTQTSFVGDGNVTGNDYAHAAPSIMVDDGGYIHIGYGGYKQKKAFYIKSTNPEDITAFDSEVLIESSSFGAHSYPTLIQKGTNIIYFFRGDPGSSGVALTRALSTDGGTSWGNIIDITNYYPYYQTRIDANGRVHIAWHQYDAGMKNLYYVYSDDAEAVSPTWKEADGTTVTIPFTSGTEGLIFDSSSWDSCYILGLAVDDNGKAHIVAYVNDAINTDKLLYFEYSGSTWNQSTIIEENLTNESGTIKGDIAFKNNNLYVMVSYLTDASYGADGKFEIKEWTSYNYGDDWKFNQYITTNTPTTTANPFYVRNSDDLGWFEGSYDYGVGKEMYLGFHPYGNMYAEVYAPLIDTGGSGLLNWTGSTANAIGTYISVSGICAQPNLTFDGSALCVTGTICATSYLQTNGHIYVGSNVNLDAGNAIIFDEDEDGFAKILADTSGSICGWGAGTVVLGNAGSAFVFTEGETNLLTDICANSVNLCGNISLNANANKYICFSGISTTTGRDLCVLGNQGASTSAGGKIEMYGGLGGTTSGNGGGVLIMGGNTVTASQGGGIEIVGGCSASGSGGDVFITGGIGAGYGSVCIKVSDNEPAIIASPSSCVSLYYSSAEKFKTISTGVCAIGCGTSTDWIATSDCRLKKCVTPILSALSTVTQLCGVNYILCEDNISDIGLIAQDVEKIVPQLVSHGEPSEEQVEKYNIEDNDLLGLKYDKFSALLIEAVKEQQLTINNLENRIKTLENNIHF